MNGGCTCFNMDAGPGLQKASAWNARRRDPAGPAVRTCSNGTRSSGASASSIGRRGTRRTARCATSLLTGHGALNCRRWSWSAPTRRGIRCTAIGTRAAASSGAEDLGLFPGFDEIFEALGCNGRSTTRASATRQLCTPIASAATAGSGRRSVGSRYGDGDGLPSVPIAWSETSGTDAAGCRNPVASWRGEVRTAPTPTRGGAWRSRADIPLRSSAASGRTGCRGTRT